MAEIENAQANTEVELPGLVSSEDMSKLVQDVESEITNRNAWENKLTELYKRRIGYKTAKTYPWPGCSNINIPQPDKMIRKQKPMYFNSIFVPRPIMTYTPVGVNVNVEKSRRIEQFYDWLLRSHMGQSRAIRPTLHRIDAMCTYGKSHIKATWEHTTERVTRKYDMNTLGIPSSEKERAKIQDEQLVQLAKSELALDPTKPHDRDALVSAIQQFRAGERFIEISHQDVVYSGPRWDFVDTRDLIVPWDSRDDVDGVPWVAHRLYKQDRELRHGAEAGLYDKNAVDKLLETANLSTPAHQRNQLDSIKNQREGLIDRPNTSNLHEIWEWYGWKDIDGDGLDERVVVRCSPKMTDMPLKVIEYPYDHGMWPFTSFNYEENEPRWYSPRGIPELIKDLHAEMNAQHNGKLDRMTIQNSLSAVVKQNSPIFVNRQKIRWKPGAMLPYKTSPDEFRPITWQFADFSFDAEERNLKAFMEEYVGVTDFGLSNVNQNVERRTAREVDEISASADQVASLDVATDQGSMARLHMQTLKLWVQHGPPDVLVKVAGDGLSPFMFNRDEIYDNFEVTPAGTVRNSNATLRSQQALNIMQIGADPTYGRFLNHFTLLKDYVENAADFRSGDRYVQEPGIAVENASMEQVSEINWMQIVGQVHHVDMADPHEIHLTTIQAALQKEMDDEIRLLIVGHMALHMIAMGNKDLAQQVLEETGFQVSQQGQKLIIITPQQQEEARRRQLQEQGRGQAQQ